MEMEMDLFRVLGKEVTRATVAKILENGVRFLPTDNQLVLGHLHHRIHHAKPRFAFMIESDDFFRSSPLSHTESGLEVDGAYYFFMSTEKAEYPHSKRLRPEVSPGTWILKGAERLRHDGSEIGTKHTRVWHDQKGKITDWTVDAFYPPASKSSDIMLIKLYKRKTNQGAGAGAGPSGAVVVQVQAQAQAGAGPSQVVAVKDEASCS